MRARSPALLRLAFLLTGDRHLAEDLVQTALAKVMLRWDGVVRGGDPHPYVRTVVIRTALQWRRRRWRGEQPTGTVPDSAHRGDPTAAVDSRERLRLALRSLPPRQRAVVVLRHYEDLSEAQVAALLGCSVGTVKSQSAKGIDRLRRVLAGDGGRPSPQEKHEETP